MKSIGIVALAVCFAFSAVNGSAQGDLGKGRKERGQQGSGSQGSGSQGGSGLGKGQGGGNSGGGGTGRSQGGGNSGGGNTGRGQGGGNSGGGSSSGGSSSGLGKGRSQGGGSSSGGGWGSGQGSSGSSSGGLGRSQGGGNSGSGGGSNSGYGRSQGGSSSGDLGRINGQLDRTNSIGKGSEQGRSGSSGYGSNNNRGRNDGAFKIDSPQINLNKGSLPSQVFRTETVRVNSRWRDGYSSYYDNWRDDYFYYPYYTFSPWNSRRDCTLSPWYYYPNLPGYILSTRIFFNAGTSCEWGIGTVYQWSRGGGWGWSNNRSDSGLDEAIDDLVYVFERNDRRALSRLVPRRGRVNIYMDGAYCYSIDADDFYDLMMDNALSTRTTRYSINRVTRHRDTVQVSASHEFVDPWGRRQCVYHHYRLEEDRYGYVITDFLTSGRP